MSGEVGLRDDHRHPEDQQQHPGRGDRQLGGPVEPEQERDHPDRAGGDQTGAEELDRQPHEPDQDQQVGNVRVDEDLEQLVLERHVVVLDPKPGGVERLGLRPLDLEAVQLCDQRLLVGRDQVDQARPLGLLGRQVLRLGDELIGQPRVSPVVRSERPHGGGRVVLDLPVEVAAPAIGPDRDRGRRADVGLRGHRGDVGGLRDVGAGRGRPGAVGGDVDHHRQRRRGHVLDDRAHRVGQAARRVEPDDRDLRILRGGVVERARDPPLGGRVDRRLKLDRVGDAPRRLLGEGRRDRERDAHQRERAERKQAKPPALHALIIRPSRALTRVALDVVGEGVDARVLALLNVGELAARVVERRRREADRGLHRLGDLLVGVAEAGIGERVLPQEVLRGRARVVGVDTQERDPLAESRRQPLKPGRLHVAGAAP